MAANTKAQRSTICFPVSLTGGPVDDANSFAPVYKPVLTGAGQAHPITRLNEDRGSESKSVERAAADLSVASAVECEAGRLGVT